MVTLAEAVAVVRDQTLPALDNVGWADHHVEALRVLLELAGSELAGHKAEMRRQARTRRRLAARAKPAATLLLTLLPALCSGQATAPEPAHAPLAAATYAELGATTVQVTGMDAEPKSYVGAQFLGQAGFGRWAVAVRGRVEGLPAEYKSGEVETFRSAEGYVSAHHNSFRVQDVTCGPAVTVGYAVALDKGHPIFAHNMTGQLGIHCAAGKRTVMLQAGSWQPLPGVSGTVAIIWPLSDRISWHGDFGVGARGQRVFRIAATVSLKFWGKR